MARPKTEITWQCGVTTVPSRMGGLLVRVLKSLESSGFVNPRLFIDGTNHGFSWTNCGQSFREPKILPYGNWHLGLLELYIRNPRAQRYAMFQDDMVCCKNLRPYLDACKMPDRGYWNLYSFPENDRLAQDVLDVPGNPFVGWHLSNQRGRGAVALVFSNDCARALLSSRHMINKHMDDRVDPHSYQPRGTQNIDGAVVTALALEGWKEWVHAPSLVDHVGTVSTIRDCMLPAEWQIKTFPGEEFDAMSFLREGNP